MEKVQKSMIKGRKEKQLKWIKEERKDWEEDICKKKSRQTQE